MSDVTGISTLLLIFRTINKACGGPTGERSGYTEKRICRGSRAAGDGAPPAVEPPGRGRGYGRRVHMRTVHILFCSRFRLLELTPFD